MSQPSRQQLLDGQASAKPQPIMLRAGALSLLYDGGSLRHITVNGEPVLHQVYAAVRDHNWGTVPGDMRDVNMDIREDSFDISYSMVHEENDISFTWQAKIIGTADSQMIFSFDGQANSTFKRNRIGFCVLHPMTLAGKGCAVEHVDGRRTEGKFPDLIAPHQPFFDIRAIEHSINDHALIRVLMEGDSFEMEDQRNWIDASYKTYCTPLGLPFPVTVEAGERISQKITIQIIGDVDAQSSTDDIIHLNIDDTPQALPVIGLALPSHGEVPSESEIQRLKTLKLAHLRADIHLSRADVDEQLAYAADYASKLDTSLELAIFLSDDAEQELALVADWLKSNMASIARIAIFHEKEKSTSRKWVELARQILADFTIPIGAGTNAFFTELNRERPPADILDFVIYSINPQVHAFDNLSLVETLAAHVETLRTARSFSENADIVVSPVTFKMRFNPNATGASPETAEDELPLQVDPRQMSFFGGGWTTGSIKYLAESGVNAATYYETSGWRGLMETASGSPLADKFPSIAGTVFPMYFVFRALADFVGGDVQISQTSQSLKVESLVLRKGSKQRIILANLTASTQTLTLDGEGMFDCWILDAENAVSVLNQPENFWQLAERREFSSIELSPYALAILDKVYS